VTSICELLYQVDDYVRKVALANVFIQDLSADYFPFVIQIIIIIIIIIKAGLFPLFNKFQLALLLSYFLFLLFYFFIYSLSHSLVDIIT